MKLKNIIIIIVGLLCIDIFFLNYIQANGSLFFDECGEITRTFDCKSEHDNELKKICENTVAEKVAECGLSPDIRKSFLSTMGIWLISGFSFLATFIFVYILIKKIIIRIFSKKSTQEANE